MPGQVGGGVLCVTVLEGHGSTDTSRPGTKAFVVLGWKCIRGPSGIRSSSACEDTCREHVQQGRATRRRISSHHNSHCTKTLFMHLQTFTISANENIAKAIMIFSGSTSNKIITYSNSAKLLTRLKQVNGQVVSDVFDDLWNEWCFVYCRGRFSLLEYEYENRNNRIAKIE